MNHVGISCGFHDAAITVINDVGEITFAGHSERYSGKKHDPDLNYGIVNDALRYVDGNYFLHYYEKPLLKAVRQLQAGQKIGPLSPKKIIGKKMMKEFNNRPIDTHGHHLCHAAAGFQTSPYDEATVIVIDAIGELDTITIWDAHYDEHGHAQYKKIWSRSYPDSIGLMYSAMTKRVGLKPLDEEYIMMGMAAYGKPTQVEKLEELVRDDIVFTQNLHIGLPEDFFSDDASIEDIAATTQSFTEYLVLEVMNVAFAIGKSSNLVYGGGVALNCLANRLIGPCWIMPNPGDAGSSLGAAALGYGGRLQWKDAYLGHDIKGEYPVENVLKELYSKKIVGVASGRAEFGPRALGNRSLLADPRGAEIKDRVNEIKRRQKFRPFAPVILEEHLQNYFDMPDGWSTSRYMQVVAHCRNPDLFPAIVHVDGTSRVQTVPKDDSGIRKLLERWYAETGCPMLLNTSLNVRGEPMINDRLDADRFENLYKVKVCS